MDDLEHSVHISEQDWESFYEESEECSIEEARLAGLDDSLFSDTDDEINSTQESIIPQQASPDKLYTGHGAEVQSEVNCEAEKTHKWLGDKTDEDKSAEQMAVISLNDSANVTSDGSTSVKVISPADQQQNASKAKNFREHDESCRKDKLGQAAGEQIQDTEYVVSSEKEVSKVIKSSATPQKEKERWFVTVNDSPTKQRLKSGINGQKKGKKKKSSRKLVKQTTSIKEKCLISNYDKEAEQEEKTKAPNSQVEPEQLLQTNCECIYSKIDDVHEGPFLSSVQKIGDEPVPKIVHTSETPSRTTKNVVGCTFNFESNANIFNNTLEDASKFNLKACSCTHSSEQMHEQELSNYSQTGDTFSFQLDTQNQEPPNEVLEAAIGSTCPVYALSSFWDEMEKLTINSILHLRSTHSGSPSSGTVSPGEIDACMKDKGLLGSNNRNIQDSLMDDTADSDYFTQVDDSKPDRSSCEFSNFSDFDEEYLQILNQSTNSSPEPQNVKQTESSEPNYVPEQELKLASMNSESASVDFKLCPQEGVMQYCSPAIEEDVYRNVFLTSELDSNGQYEVNSIKRTRSPVVAVGDVLDDQCSLTFSEILANDIDDDMIKTFYPDIPSCSIVSFPYTHSLTVHETYDDFLSDFEDGNLFFPTMQGETVPIYSTSGSVVRDLVIPGVNDGIEIDTENNNSPLRIVTPFSRRLKMSTSLSEMSNVCCFTSQKSNWWSFISPRRMMFMVRESVWCQKFSSWILPKEAKKATSYVSEAQQIIPQMHSGITALQQFPEQQEETHHNVLISKREDTCFSVKQADMCLACIAFASWVLKSSNPQSTNMWKAVLLANVSAFSAIQYLRKYEKEEVTDDL